MTQNYIQYLQSTSQVQSIIYTCLAFEMPCTSKKGYMVSLSHNTSRCANDSDAYRRIPSSIFFSLFRISTVSPKCTQVNRPHLINDKGVAKHDMMCTHVRQQGPGGMLPPPPIICVLDRTWLLGWFRYQDIIKF